MNPSSPTLTGCECVEQGTLTSATHRQSKAPAARTCLPTPHSAKSHPLLCFLPHLSFAVFLSRERMCQHIVPHVLWDVSKDPTNPCLGSHSCALSHGTIIVPHSLNPIKTRLNSFLLLPNPLSLSRERKVFQGATRAQVSGRSFSSSLSRRKPLGKEDLNSTCPARKEREDPAVPVHLHPELCAGCAKTPQSRAEGAVPPYS